MSTQSKQKTIAVLGANGRLSREVARAFHAAGWQVTAVTRDGKCTALESCAGMRFAAADALDRTALIDVTKGSDVIFNGLNPPYTDWRTTALPMAENAVAAVKASGALHLFPGNVYNFGSGLPGKLTPETPFRPDHSKAEIRCRMEAMFAKAAQEDGVRTSVLRAGDFFGGDGKGSWFDLAIISRLKLGKVVYPGSRNIPHAWAYLPDLAKAFVMMAEKASGLPMVSVHHFDGHNVTGEALHEAVEKVMGRKLKRSGLPRLIFTLGGLFSPMMREVREVYYLWEKPHAVVDDGFANVFDSPPHTPLEVAVREAIIAQGIIPDTERTGSVATNRNKAGHFESRSSASTI